MRRIVLIFTMLLVAAPALWAFQKPKSEGQKKKVTLTEEEKEMLRDRELLENLELLQMLDKILYLELFTDPDGKKEKAPAAPANKKRERKK